MPGYRISISVGNNSLTRFVVLICNMSNVHYNPTLSQVKASVLIITLHILYRE